jgi:hypothetical protein
VFRYDVGELVGGSGGAATRFHGDAAAGGAGGDNFTIVVDGVTVRFDQHPSGSVREAGIDGIGATR